MKIYIAIEDQGWGGSFNIGVALTEEFAENICVKHHVDRHPRIIRSLPAELKFQPDPDDLWPERLSAAWLSADHSHGYRIEVWTAEAMVPVAPARPGGSLTTDRGRPTYKEADDPADRKP